MNNFEKIRLKILKLNTPFLFYRLHRFLFCKTKGAWNYCLTSFVKIMNPKVSLPAGGIIRLDSKRLKEIIEQIQTDGYYVFEERLHPQTIENIKKFAATTPVRYATTSGQSSGYSSEKIPFEQTENIHSPRFQMDSQDIFLSPELRSIILDPSICKIAQEYLGSRPILDLVALWWSKPDKTGVLRDYAAQKYHFDMDRIRFLKFFFYLTDVDEENGPHCFVKGTHNSLPKQFRKDQRFEDDEVISYFGKDNIKKFCAPKGSIFAVDTSGLHKGEPLMKGNRLIFQTEFANSMFGQVYEKVELDRMPVDLATTIDKYPLIYGPIFQTTKSI